MAKNTHSNHFLFIHIKIFNNYTIKNTYHNFAMAIANQFLSILINIYQKKQAILLHITFFIVFLQTK